MKTEKNETNDHPLPSIIHIIVISVTISEKTKEDPHLSGTKTEFHTAEKQTEKENKKQKMKKHQRDRDSVRRATDLAPCTLTPQNSTNANANPNSKNSNSNSNSQTPKRKQTLIFWSLKSSISQSCPNPFIKLTSLSPSPAFFTNFCSSRSGSDSYISSTVSSFNLKR